MGHKPNPRPQSYNYSHLMSRRNRKKPKEYSTGPNYSSVLVLCALAFILLTLLFVVL